MSKIFKNCSWCLPHVVLLLMLFVSVGFMLGSSLQESAIMDELAHIPAGYGYVTYLDYRLNPEHPPLIKALAALPLPFMHLNFPTSLAPWASDLNGQWDAGRQFLYEVNNGRADEIVFMSRVFPIILTILLVVLIYAWSKKLFGPWWALVPAGLTAFSPHVLAHGHYVTTDIGASLGFFLGLFGFWMLFYEKREILRSRIPWTYVLYAGLLFGVAQLLKFSLVLLIPLFIFFIIALFLSAGKNVWSWKYAWRLIWTLALVCIIGYVLVGVIYILFTWNYPIQKQVADTTILLGEQISKGSLLARATLWASGVPILRAVGHYALGVIMVGQRSAGGNTAYFLGMNGNGGWWYYFPVVFLLKESLPALGFLLLGFLMWIKRTLKSPRTELEDGRLGFWASIGNFIQHHMALFIMFSFIVFYWVYSIQSPLNIGFRHILPTVPFLYILATSSIRTWIRALIPDKGAMIWSRFWYAWKRSIRYGFLAFLMVWVFVESAVAYPNFLSYFNEVGGGVWGGYMHAVDSNYDWGQDLKKLRSFVEENGVTAIAVDYFGGGHVPYYIPNAVLWDESKGNPLSENVTWLAVSINELIYDVHATDPVGAEFSMRRYRWIPRPLEPYARIGTSIFVFRLR